MVKVLLADTDCLFGKAFRKMINDIGDCTLVGIVRDEETMLALCNEHHPDILFANARVGRYDGIDLCQAAKKYYPDLLCNILTGHYSIELLKKAMESDVNELLLKPVSVEKLSSIVDRCKDPDQNPDRVILEELMAAIEERDYKKSYMITQNYVNVLFENSDTHQRKEKLGATRRKLFYMISGLHVQQKEYYIQKFELTSMEANKRMLCCCWLMEIITEVFRQFCTMKYAHMNKAFQFIEQNRNNEISLTDLSKEAGISSGYLSRIFKKYYKISVVDYIHLRKILRAKQYMATSEMNISDISFLLGYSEAGYFCKIFKKYEGRTPSSFQKEYALSGSRVV